MLYVTSVNLGTWLSRHASREKEDLVNIMLIRTFLIETMLIRIILRAPLLNSLCHARVQGLAEVFIAVSAICRMCFLTKPERWFINPLRERQRLSVVRVFFSF